MVLIIFINCQGFFKNINHILFTIFIQTTYFTDLLLLVSLQPPIHSLTCSYCCQDQAAFPYVVVFQRSWLDSLHAGDKKGFINNQWLFQAAAVCFSSRTKPDLQLRACSSEKGLHLQRTCKERLKHLLIFKSRGPGQQQT